jgi:hypothetical protein
MFVVSLFTTPIKITTPSRLQAARKHMLMVCQLNRETWRLIRAERDDDHEWLPNPRQKGVLGLPMTDETIDGWLKVIDELEGLLEGDRLLDTGLGIYGINLRAFIDEPPAAVVLSQFLSREQDAKYRGQFVDKKKFDAGVIQRLLTVFGNQMGLPYAVRPN